MEYVNGRGVVQNFAQGVAWWRKAAEQGHAVAQCNLGAAGQTPGSSMHWICAALLTLFFPKMVEALAIRVHAIRVLARHFTSRVTILQDHALVRDGLYRVVRHPSYLGEILILIGLGALMANAVSFVAAPLFTTVALLRRIRLEERALAERFGQAYEDDRRATWRLLPLIW